MSLIGDALRKARQEAAERESNRQGILFSAKISDGPARSNLGLGLALGAIIAVAATVAGGGAVWWLLSRSEPTDSAEPPTTVSISDVSDAPIATPISSPAPAKTETHTVSPVVTARAPSTESALPEPKAGQTGAQSDVEAESAPAVTPEEDKAAEGFVGMEDGDEIYVMEADLGQIRLSLDFIVFRADDPFAEINGVELHTGGVVEGYRVKAIERDRVRLSNGRRNIVLRAP